MSGYEAAVDPFLAAITAGDDERAELLSRAAVDDLVFFGPEPNEAFESREQLGAYLAQMSTMLPPGTTVLRTTPVHEHHGQVRWRMAFRLPDGTEPYRFEGFGEGDGGGRLRKIVTFDVTKE